VINSQTQFVHPILFPLFALVNSQIKFWFLVFTLRGFLGDGNSVKNNRDFTSADQTYTDTDTSDKVSKRPNNTSTKIHTDFDVGIEA